MTHFLLFKKPMRRLTLLFAIVFLICGIVFSNNSDSTGFENHPIYPPGEINIKELKEAVAPIMKMSLREVIAEVPEESGIFFIGCPNCHSGAQEMDVLSWKLGMGSKVRCNYCDMLFPNEEFPNNQEEIITTPSGSQQVYRYYEDSSGYPYYFEAHAWYERWLWIRPMAEKLAKIWYVTGDNEYGDRAAAIAGRFAQVFPDYAVRYDHPSAPVQFFPADQKWPYEGIAPYNGAKWRWWAYGDIPTHLATVYDLLQSGYDWSRLDNIIGEDTDKRIARDLLRLGYEFTTANPELYTNMSPVVYTNMIRIGRILQEPEMVHEAVNRFREFFPKGFFADGWWMEGTSAYHAQSITLLGGVVDVLKGYIDPPDWAGEYLNNVDLTKETSLYEKALRVYQEAVLPNGRFIPINDTEGFSRGEATDSTVSRLWPAMGNAAIGTGKGEDQIMLNVNWSGNYGHSHYDNGSIILYAAGQELLSDIGYTHTKYNLWTKHTTSHNTVVIDQKGQDTGSREKPVTGRLKFYDDKDPQVKVVDVDASPAYSVAEEYRRRLIMVHAASGRDYIIDRFDVSGGEHHDWFLHGMCEQEGELKTSLELITPLESLVPEWGSHALPKNQYETDWVGKRFHSYAFLRDIKSGQATSSWTATWRYDGSGLRSHILSQSETEAYQFRSPSVRQANEDDNKLDNYMRNGVMQRHTGGSSTFLAVHEPFREAPWIESVQMKKGVMLVKYQLNGAVIEDRIVLNENEITVISSAGWEYHSGTSVSGEVKALEHTNGVYSLLIDRKAPPVNYVRLDFSDGGTYYCPVASWNGNRLELKNDPGFTLDKKGKVQFYVFPQSEYADPLRYTLYEVKKQK